MAYVDSSSPPPPPIARNSTQHKRRAKKPAKAKTSLYVSGTAEPRLCRTLPVGRETMQASHSNLTHRPETLDKITRPRTLKPDKEVTFNTALGPLRAARGAVRFVCGTEGREPTRTFSMKSLLLWLTRSAFHPVICELEHLQVSSGMRGERSNQVKARLAEQALSSRLHNGSRRVTYVCSTTSCAMDSLFLVAV